MFQGLSAQTFSASLLCSSPTDTASNTKFYAVVGVGWGVGDEVHDGGFN